MVKETKYADLIRENLFEFVASVTREAKDDV